MISHRGRVHSWDKWHEITETYTLEDENGKIWQGRLKAIAATEREAEFTGFIGFCQTLSSMGVNIPKTIRRADADFKWGEGEDPSVEDK
jgi:hypothetical protein